MAVYKVPQDVEAEDKLLGPFSFRQFVYLMIAAGSGVAMFFLGRINFLLALLPLPFFLVFGILALPLRKDQPIETYLAAIIRFHLKPRKRFWQPDGTLSLIEITNPIVDASPVLKDVSGQEAATRLSFLSQVVDSQGWSTRGVAAPTAGTSLQDTVVNDAMAVPDILDNTSNVAQSFGERISQTDQQQRDNVMQRMQTAITTAQPMQASSPALPPTNYSPISATTEEMLAPGTLQYSPYPSSMRQAVLSRSGERQPAEPARNENVEKPDDETATESLSPDIIRLANNNDLSVAAIAREAERLSDKDDDDEVVISLR